MEFPHLSFQELGTNLFPVELSRTRNGQTVRYFNPDDPSGIFLVTGRIDCIRYPDPEAGENGPCCMFLKAENDSPFFQKIHYLQMRHLRDITFWDLADAAIRHESICVRGLWIETERYRFICPNVAVDLDNSVYIVVDYVPSAMDQTSSLRVREGDAVTLKCALIRQDRYNFSVECSEDCLHESLPRVCMYSVRAFFGDVLEDQTEDTQDGPSDSRNPTEAAAFGGWSDEEVQCDEEVTEYEDEVSEYEEEAFEEGDDDGEECEEAFAISDMNVTGMGI
ncbi:hypothetical protein R3P38DRAFT_3236554 [Favolaschia claudopus]|uniref:Recombination activating protein 2 n=1 Tax=Favolaschia claudopus TaxID=2862362 RepID=A0AAV9ZD00_9AGAR